jgi:tetratricopeptide (TPR) repeat protein
MLARRGLADTQPDLLDALQEIQLLYAGGKPAAALELTQRLLNNPRVTQQTEIPRFALDAYLGAALLRLARYPAAIAAFEAGFEGARVANQRHFMQKIRLWVLEALIQSGRIAEAEARLAATPDVADEIRKATQAGVTYLLAQARFAMAHGSPEQADALAQRALQTVRGRNQRTDQQSRGATLAAARTALALQDWARASALADAALEITRAEAIDPDSSAFVGEALIVKAQSERGAGSGKAAGLARQALVHLRENVGPEHPLVQVALELARDEPSFQRAYLPPGLKY